MSVPTDSTQTPVTRASLLQKYLLLHSRRHALQRQPESVISSTLPEPSCIASAKPLIGSSRESDKDLVQPPINELLDPGYATRLESKLLDINQEIKITLTELGNLGNERHDQRFKVWVQQDSWMWRGE
ncbi:hypothetical protein DL98DRAFT_541669 [Cadophora sp. DSE1049]|nr:hypothetical protein DL98DRAFT_541669 [Cadophora sp. DSE1049]